MAIRGWIRRRLLWGDLRRASPKAGPAVGDPFYDGSRGTLILHRTTAPRTHLDLDYSATNDKYAVKLTEAQIRAVEQQPHDWRIEFRDRTAKLLRVEPSDKSTFFTAVLTVDLASSRSSRLSSDGVVAAGIVPEQEGPSLESAHVLYGEVASAWRQLTDVRFKLLALVPVLSGIGLFAILDSDGTLGSAPRAVRASAAVFGFVVTLGLKIYDSRNSILYDDLISRGKHLEGAMGFTTGVFLGRLNSRWPVNHDMALRLIYLTTLLAWLGAFVVAVAGWVQADTGCQYSPLHCALLGLA